MSHFIGYYTGIKRDRLPSYINKILYDNLFIGAWTIDQKSGLIYFYGADNDVSNENIQEKKLLKRLDLLQPFIDIPLKLVTYEVYNDYCKLISSTIYNKSGLSENLNVKLKIWIR